MDTRMFHVLLAGMHERADHGLSLLALLAQMSTAKPCLPSVALSYLDLGITLTRRRWKEPS